MPGKQPDISTYSAAELMQYASGRMAPAERHALEKAALEDPFLAEALDGYMEAMATQPAATIQAQANRLQPVTEEKPVKVISLWQYKNIRVAVAALFIAGAGWAVFSLLQKPAAPATAIVQQSPVALPSDTNPAATALASEATPQAMAADSSLPVTASLSKNEDRLPPAAAPSSGTLALERKKEPVNNFTVPATPYNLQQADVQRPDSAMPVAAENGLAMAKPSPAKTAMRRMQAPEHVFKAQITDARSNPVPYANIMIEGQNFGTYSDATGRFNFISDDSLLHIRVRSVGYASQSLALQTARPETHIVLQEDQLLANSLPLTVQSKSKSASPLKKSIIERDSIIGQETTDLNIPFYDQYLLNNNRISALPTLNRQVQLSFDVSETGEPVNITVVKSSGGPALDEEAIRLVKEGPKLKADTAPGKKKKVTVRF